MTGTVVQINIARDVGAPLEALDSAELEAGKGIAGDRYYQPNATAALDAVTLVEEEQAAAASEALGMTITAAATRRNIVTRGVSLNDLVGKEFKVGTTTLYGSELCEPCKELSELLAGERSGPEILRALAHRAGLRCAILSGGRVNPGDLIQGPDEDP